MRCLLFILLLLSGFFSRAQQSALILGNHTALCLPDSTDIDVSDDLPSQLEQYHIILLFSNAQSSLSEADIDRIISFVETGGGLYTGSENWPLQAESNLITDRLYRKQSFGNYNDVEAEINQNEGNLQLSKENTIPAGNTPVAFPLDPRLKVEAWISDQPLILSGNVGEGRIIIDGGYSRFYCDQRDIRTDLLFRKILLFLGGN